MALQIEQKIIMMDEDDRDELMRVHMEMDATANILAKIISEGLNIDTQQFRDYEEYYRELYADYDRLKNRVTEKYIENNPEIDKDAVLGWNAKYASCELIVDVRV